LPEISIPQLPATDRVNETLAPFSSCPRRSVLEGGSMACFCCAEDNGVTKSGMSAPANKNRIIKIPQRNHLSSGLEAHAAHVALRKQHKKVYRLQRTVCIFSHSIPLFCVLLPRLHQHKPPHLLAECTGSYFPVSNHMATPEGLSTCSGTVC